jgi:hypothetical protein
MAMDELFPHKQQKEMVLTGSRTTGGPGTDEEPVQITFKLVGEISSHDHHYIHVSTFKHFHLQIFHSYL